MTKQTECFLDNHFEIHLTFLFANKFCVSQATNFKADEADVDDDVLCEEENIGKTLNVKMRRKNIVRTQISKI